MLPIIDLAPLRRAASGPADTASRSANTARAIEAACRDSGFFYVTGHGVPEDLIVRLDRAARAFFALPDEIKAEIAMARGGRAWRGWFPVGAELTSGRPDRKEGLYFGAELPAADPRPLHGPNLFPAQVPQLRPAVLEYLARLSTVAQTVLSGIALSLGLDAGYFADSYTANPTILFRIFHYPPSRPADSEPADSERADSEAVEHEAAQWGVGEHTDYGLLTLLAQDQHGGLAVRTARGWIEAPPIPGTFVCNIGDMLDRLTGGWYRSTPHRVRNTSGHGRLSFPFFFDPDFSAEVPALPARQDGERHDGERHDGERHDGQVPRWDGQDLRAFTGTYGDYLIRKVSQVFPQLSDHVREA
jgi:isopenicillin N synthase-like dioxygenase